MPKRFGTPLPETFASEHKIIIVASALDASSERIVSYLSEEYGVPINAVFFSIFEGGAGQLLARSWLLDPEDVETRMVERSSVRKERGDWTGFWFVNVGVTKEEDRSWDDSKKFGFVSGGQGARWRDAMRKLSVGDKIFAYVSGRGYVGFGEVSAEAVMARDCILADGLPLLEHPLVATAYSQHQNDEELAEYVVRVDWKSTVNLSEARRYAGIFAIQQIVCKIYDNATVQFLSNAFGVDLGAAASVPTIKPLK